MTDDRIVCGAHGETPATFTCCHIATGVACGFHAGDATDDDPWPDACCDLCSAAYEADGEWSEAASALANIKLLCTHCYSAARARNISVPELARSEAGILSDEARGALVHHAVHAGQALQDRSDEKWHWRGMAHWHYDIESRTFTMSDPDRPTLIADLRLVGSYSTTTNTFQWAWETYEDDRAADAVALLRAFGEVRGIEKLTTANFECDEDDGWLLTSLAAYVLGAESVYRAPAGHLRIFMLLDNWRTLN